MLKVAALFLFFSVPCFGQAANIYLSQSGGTFSGGTACNGHSAQAYTFFNSSGNWGSGGSQIGSDTVVWICGTIACSGAGASALTFQGSGTSGHPVTIKFDTGGDLSCSSYWGDNAFTGGPGAINCSSRNYVTVDGNNVGIVENTNNGTGLGNQHNSTGIYFNDCGNPTIKNLTIRNIYLKTNVSDINEFGVGVWIVGGNNWLVTNNTINNAWGTIVPGWDANNVTTTNNVISYNTVDYGCHLISGPGDASAGTAAGGFVLDHNIIGPHMAIWNDNTAVCHGDAIGPLGAGQSGSSLNGLTISNNVITSDGCPTFGICTALIFPSGATNLQIFNNILQCNACNLESLIRLAGNGVPEINVSIYNNTLIGPTGYNTGVKMDAATNLIAKNNIFMNLGQAWWDNTGSGLTQFSSPSSANNNDYYNMAAKIATATATLNYNNFSQWQGAGYDANGTAGNPLLNGSYIPQTGSAAINLGANLTSLGIAALDADLNGSISCRPSSGNWDAGAICSGSAPQVATPTFTVGGGIYSTTQSVIIATVTSGATLCYTTDGTTPTANGAGTCTHGTTYSTAVTVASSLTLEAIGSESGFTDSSVGKASYTIGTVPLAASCSTCLIGSNIMGGMNELAVVVQ